jgi:two-component system chemotaxis response regulator CheB
MERGDVAMLSDAPPVNGHKPSADVLFDSLAHEYGMNAVAVLMTGMGEDGVSGMNAVRSAGGIAIAQSPDSCVVDSMPRAAIERRFATRIVHLDRLANVLEAICEVDKAKYMTHKFGHTSLNSEGPAETVTTRRRSI